MDRLDLYRVFVRVVDNANITRAATSLAMPRSSVSAAVQELEGRLGTRLLHRNTRRLSVTPDGAALYERCRSLLADADDIDQLFRESRGGPVGRVRLDVPSRIGRRLIAPALPALVERHPGLAIELGMNDRAVDLIADGVDCIVRVGTVAAPRLAARTIGSLELITVASPAYLERQGEPRVPDDLERHLAIGYGSSPAAGEMTGEAQPAGQTARLPLTTWDGLAAGEPCVRLLPARVSVNNVEGYIACALAGLGLIQVPRYDVLHHLRAGALREVLGAWRPAPLPLTLLTAPQERLPRRLTLIIDWLTELLVTTTAAAIPDPARSDSGLSAPCAAVQEDNSDRAIVSGPGGAEQC